MADPDLPKKIAQDLSKDNLEEVRRIFKEEIEKEASAEKTFETMEKVAENLTLQYGPCDQLDSLCDPALLNYFYLIACSDEYKEFLTYFENKLPIDYEALLFKAIEIHDAQTVNHLVTCKPKLLNIRLKKPFATKTMKTFLIECSWCEGLKETLSEIKLSGDEEPLQSEELISFEKVEKELKKKLNNKKST